MCPYKLPVKNKQGNAVFDVPCGRCAWCRKQRSLEWASRISDQLAESVYAPFVSLTYNEDYLPYRGICPSLIKGDLVRYLKRITQKEKGVKYYGVGEYGSKGGRPHYHAILFGYDITKGKNKQFLMESWPYGMVDIGVAEPKSISYIVKYVRKKLTGDLGKKVYKFAEPPFMVCSQGIGLAHAEKKKDQFKQLGCTRLNGYERGIPRYYIKKGVVDKDTVEDIKLKNQLSEAREFLKGKGFASVEEVKEYLVLGEKQAFQQEKNLVWMLNAKNGSL